VADKHLSIYRKKRDFEKTAEPSGEHAVAPSKRRRFVIQKHDATRLHYDLRLEFDGVFKSWAVTRGPSLDPHDKRLAVEVEDHPLDYGDFEGTIPKGQYGGGTVMVWDRGFWECDDPQRAYRKGKLDFILEGEKLEGGWILTRMRSREGEKRTNWLLIKHRDAFAREEKKNRILDEDASVASGRSMDDIGTTGIGQVLGSPYYISPEQAQGQRVDVRTDLYSLGVMFYEMLTGQRPYLGRSAMAIMSQHSASPVPQLPEPTAAQQPLLDRLMAKQQNARYASADELLADLGPMVAAVA